MKKVLIHLALSFLPELIEAIAKAKGFEGWEVIVHRHYLTGRIECITIARTNSAGIAETWNWKKEEKPPLRT